tara:strand:- start:1037 stop:1780 length:744 start_codon:yes stop_codon:yes gene_type:complete
MKSLTAGQLQENWDDLIKLINDTFSNERKVKLLQMYEHFKDRMMFAPASSQEHFHNCFPGGYVEHILNIVKFAKAFHKVWAVNGAVVDDYTEEELVFACMHHDLGKVGDLENDHYIPNDSEWHRKNQGKIYISNPDLHFMTAPDRGIWILNQFGIRMTQNEMIGIKLADGMYDDGNIQYLKNWSPAAKLKTNMALIIHQADMATTRIEYEQNQKTDNKPVNTKVPKTKDEQKQVDNLKSKFDELFAN